MSGQVVAFGDWAYHEADHKVKALECEACDEDWIAIVGRLMRCD